MNDNKKIEELKSNYMNIEIPNKLNDVVDDALNKHYSNKKRKAISNFSKVAASISVVVAVVNVNPTITNALEEIPVVGNVVKVINFRHYSIDKNGYDISIDVPKIEGLKDKNLEYKMNKDFEDTGKKLYDEYLNEMQTLEKEGIEGKESVKAWYEVKTDNENNLSIVVYNHYALGSSNTTREFYNIDRKNETALTLEGMFEGTEYVDVISENIKEQMRERMKNNPNEVYWIDTEEGYFDFDKINKNQGFYINDNNEIVICFDKYEVAPGAEGLSEFAIPKEITNELIK